MQRWKVCGEVLDSDDEDIGFSVESQSPQRPRKKQRVEDGDGIVGQHGHVVEQHKVRDENSSAGDEENWLLPQVAKTYGRNARDSRTTSTQDEVTSKPNRSHDNDATCSPFPNPFQAGCTEKNEVNSEQLHSTASDGLPDLDDLFRKPHTVVNQDLEDDSPLSSAPPSPVVEVTVPPTQANLQALSDSLGPGPEDNDFTSTFAVPPEQSVMAQRTFRARKEKQLHPYMFDLAQYHRQFRERGLRPVRYLDTQQAGEETQMSERIGQADSDPPSSPALSTSSVELSQSPLFHDLARNGSKAGQASASQDSDDELPGLDKLIENGRVGNLQHPNKRRKMLNGSKAVQSSSFQRLVSPALESNDDLSMPPSPPPTSTGFTAAPENLPQTVRFRFPRGHTPKPLPTPDVSSESRGNANNNALALSDSELEISSVRTPAPRRLQQPHARSRSSSEASGEERPQERVEVRLRQERKRIKGVLPASWLKLDLQAQRQISTSPARGDARRLETPSSVSPQKGVARTVRRANDPMSSTAVPISDDEEDTLSRRSSVSPPRMRQSRLHFERAKTSSTAVEDLVDDERMEVDWIDPMFATSSRTKHPDTRTRRQPKITEAWSKDHPRTDEYAEERHALNRYAGRSQTRTRARTRTKHHRLSILDAPSRSPSNIRAQPAFIRLAMRTARQRPGEGRHLPIQKQIRLATKHDTEDAFATLREWREGTIVPVQDGAMYESLVDADLMDSDRERFSAHGTTPRFPLSELPRNVQQSPSNRQSKASPNPSQRHVRRHVSQPRRSRIQQTRLEPFRLESPVPDNQPRTAATATDHQRPTVWRERQPTGLPKGAQYRDAQLECLELVFDREHRSTAFERRIQLLTENVIRGRRLPGVDGFRMERCLDETDHPTNRTTGAGHGPKELKSGLPGTSKLTSTLPRRPKKQQARRLNAESLQYRQPSEPLPEREASGQSTSVIEVTNTSGPELQGLGAFGTKYATDFDIIPLAVGTYFHESSFIGSGDFAASLNFAARNLSVYTGRISIRVEADVFEWGPWTEDVAVGLSNVSKAIVDILKPSDDGFESSDGSVDGSLAVVNVDYLLRSVVRYISRCLVFLDTVDRRFCVSQLVAFVEDLLDAFAGDDLRQAKTSKDAATRCLQYAAVISKQASILSRHESISREVKLASADVVAKATYRLACSSFPDPMVDLRTFLEENRCTSSREAGIRDDDTIVCSVVILHHVLQNDALGAQAFWATVDKALNINTSSLSMAPQLDNTWYSVFTILPFLDIDVQGNTRTGSRMKANEQNWTFVKRLVDRTLELYPGSISCHRSTMNDYLRAVLRRCFQLTTRWGWWRCETVLGAFFDFFAKRGLAQLHKEDSHGSPKFLQILDDEPSLEVQPEDRSFTVFLKLLASGLQGMRKHHVYSEKKIGAIAWRFIPNHGRAYRKDAEVRQDDLDALRNHHDLLCTLYYASPPAHRLRVVLVQELVDHSMSHREACRLSVRAWSNLASFQASTNEPIDNLGPLFQWFADMLNTTLSQYRLARTEVEQEASSNQMQGALPVSRAMIEDTIARNQRQIVATLVDLLAALKRALRAASSLEAAAQLLAQTTFWRIYEIFDPSSRRLHGMLDESLEVFAAALKVQAKFDSAVHTQNSDEDSQDYGDSSALLELASTQAVPQQADRRILDVLHGPLAQLVSDTFGADAIMEDALTVKLVDVWSAYADAMAKADKRTLTNYIHDYTSEAWIQLRETEQKQKFTPYFLSRIVELTSVDIVETGILRSWLVSLVDREAMLKYQHRLTSALLEQHTDSLLLHNLPFSRNAKGTYAITLHEFRQRRLSLLSTALFNMHEDIAISQLERPHTVAGLRRNYSELLKRVMQAMRQNYQDLQVTSTDGVASVDVQGAYVEFVQHIISSMQQYTTDICQIDRFFTDSSAFPLPATDPMYVVGRLRAYTPKLADSRKRKELSVLIQTVSERAAVDDQQPYLVTQLITAMTGSLERGKSEAPSLRRILLTSIFPAYIENALSGTCSWIVAQPILKSCGPVLADLLYTVVFEDRDSVQCAFVMLQTVLESMAKPLDLALARPDLLRAPYAQSLLTTMFGSARQCLTIAHFLRTMEATHGCVADVLHYFDESAAAIESYLVESDDFNLMVDRQSEGDVSCSWSDTLEFSRKQVHEKFKNDWHVVGGQYYMKRGNVSVEVRVCLGDEEEIRSAFLDSTKAFRESYARIFSDGKEKDCGDILTSVVM